MPESKYNGGSVKPLKLDLPLEVDVYSKSGPGGTQEIEAQVVTTSASMNCPLPPFPAVKYELS